MGYEDETPKEVPERKPEQSAISGGEKDAIGDKYEHAGRSVVGDQQKYRDAVGDASLDSSGRPTMDYMQRLTDAEEARQRAPESTVSRTDDPTVKGQHREVGDHHSIVYNPDNITGSSDAAATAAHEVAHAKQREGPFYSSGEGESVDSNSGTLDRREGESYTDYADRYGDYLDRYRAYLNDWQSRTFNENGELSDPRGATPPEQPAKPEQPAGTEPGAERYDDAMKSYLAADQDYRQCREQYREAEAQEAEQRRLAEEHVRDPNAKHIGASLEPLSQSPEDEEDE